MAEEAGTAEAGVAPATVAADTRPAAFLDRDGVINIDGGYVFRPEDLAFTPTAVEGIRLFNEAGWRVIVVTNQSGVARGLYGLAEVERFHAHLQARLRAAGARIDAFLFCPFHPEGTVAAFARHHEDRKPGPGMLLKAMARWPTDRARSVMVGDRDSDMAAAAAAGIRGVLVEPDLCDLAAVARAAVAEARGAGPAGGEAGTALRRWLVAKALPFWAEAGWDARRERFRERLGLDGLPLPVPHRAMVQARQIYVFAHAARLGWFPEGGRLAAAALRALRRDFETPGLWQASFAFSVDEGGAVVSPVRDAYAHAFVLFALAHLFALTGERALLTLADRVIAFCDGRLADIRHGGLFDQHPRADRAKRQNPHMHLLEAYLALEAAAPARGYLERADTLVALFRERLFDAGAGVLREYFSPAWGPHHDPALRHVVEPGHHFEWVWLLRQYETLAGADMADLIGPLYATARRHGCTPAGLVHDEVTPSGAVGKPSHRLWPHAEALKAAAVRHADGDPGALAFAGATTGALMRHFLDRPFAGGWIDQIDPAGRPLVGYVPASSLYHLMLAAAESTAGFGAPGAEHGPTHRLGASSPSPASGKPGAR